MLVILWVMARRFWRDPAGLILAFILPPVVFLVFAAVFASGANGRIDVRAGVVDQIESRDSNGLLGALRARLGGRMEIFKDPGELREAELADQIDAGLVLHGDLAQTPSPAEVLVHPGRKAAAEILRADVERAANQSLGPLMGRRQISLLPKASQSMVLKALAAGGAGRIAAQPPLVTETVIGGPDPMATYYAGAVSILFLMFTATQGATSLIDDRLAGLRLRLGLSLRGVLPIMGGRMAWLTVLGIGQALALFTVAAVIYRLPVLASFGPWCLTALAAAAASAGLALALAAGCDTREQAQTLSTFLILILAAVGGSMAPRFLMPAALQGVGWFTPHAWVIQTYQTVLWRRTVNVQVIQGWLVLFAFAGVGWTASLYLEGRRRL